MGREPKEGVTLRHAWKFHRSRKIDKGEKPPTEKEFREVMYSFNKVITDSVLTGLHVQLPHSMGFLRVKKMNTKKRKVDFHATKIHGMKIYHDNRHTGGFGFGFSWAKANNQVKNMIHYKFVPTRGNSGNSLKERLSSILKTPNGYKRFITSR